MKIQRGVSLFSLIAALSIFINPANDVLSEENNPDSDEKAPYTIQKGDTLWDLSEEHLKNPFLWPYIWERNRYIRNPDLIYPGRRLIMPYGIFLESPDSVETEKQAGPAESEVESKAETRFESEVESESDSEVWSLVPTPVPPPAAPPQEVISAPVPLEPISPPVPVSLPSPSVSKSTVPQVKASMASASPSAVLQRGGMAMTELIRESGYITDRIESSGVITGSAEERSIYADGDDVKLLLKDNASVGDRLTIFQPPAPVMHPKTGKRVGMLFVPVGELEITGVQGRNAAGRIVKSYTTSSQGDYIQPYKPSAPPTETKKTAPEISGYIIGSREGIMLNAEYSIVYLDRGASDGVIPGTAFDVIGGERHDVIGELTVISVQAATSTALVTRSMEPLDIGSEIVTTIK